MTGATATPTDTDTLAYAYHNDYDVVNTITIPTGGIAVMLLGGDNSGLTASPSVGTTEYTLHDAGGDGTIVLVSYATPAVDQTVTWNPNSSGNMGSALGAFEPSGSGSGAPGSVYVAIAL